MKEAKRIALATKEQAAADRLVYMAEIEKRFRAGKIDFGLDSHVLLECYALKNEKVIIGDLQYVQLLEPRKIDEGSLTLTNKRLLFYGAKSTQKIMLGFVEQRDKNER